MPVVGYEPYYEISDLGRARSLDRLVNTAHGGKRTSKGRLLKQQIHRGYPAVKLSVNAERVDGRIHVMVLEAFVGPRPDGQVARHLNGNPQDGRLVNLAWGTWEENAQDSLRHGTNMYAKRLLCERGHPYSGANLRISRGGARYCRACTRAYRYCYVRDCMDAIAAIADRYYAEICAKES